MAKRLFLSLSFFAGLISYGVDLNGNHLGKFDLLLRPRWEYVDIENNGLKTANAFTVKVAPKVQITPLKGLKFTTELTGVGVLYDHFSPQKKYYEFVAEENRLRVTELSVSYRWNFLNLKLGRFRVNINNQRFVGSVDWRQMPQTFDAVKVGIAPLKVAKLDFYYLFGRQGVLNKLSTKPFKRSEPINYSPVVNLTLKPYKGVKLAAYYLNLNKNSETLGGFGEIGFKPVKVHLEYAYQHNKVVSDNSPYWHGFLKANLKRIVPLSPTPVVGYEYLGKNFITPLATLHKFNGWSDIFLKYTAAKNSYGLKDIYGGLTLKPLKGTLAIFYHNFRSTKNLPNGTKKFGQEWDALYKISPIKNLSFLLKGAYYRPSHSEGSAPYNRKTVKLWFMITYKFATLF